MSINRVAISGNLTRDAELRQAGETPVLALGVAVNERRKNRQSGEWEDRANFFDVSLFGRRAEALAQYMTKGTKVAVEGRLRYESWEDGDGKRRSRVGIVADEVEFMSRREDAPSRPRPVAATPSAADASARAVAAEYDASIPF